MSKDVRWKQRFDNFQRAFRFLEKAVELGKYDALQAAGLVQSFEFTFELGWKTLKDYLEEGGFTLQTPREVIKQAHKTALIEDGHRWIEMLTKRNELSHTYNEAQAARAIELIRTAYFPAVNQVYNVLCKLE